MKVSIVIIFAAGLVSACSGRISTGDGGSGPVSVDVYGYHDGGSYGFPAGFDP